MPAFSTTMQSNVALIRVHIVWLSHVGMWDQIEVSFTLRTNNDSTMSFSKPPQNILKPTSTHYEV